MLSYKPLFYFGVGLAICCIGSAYYGYNSGKEYVEPLRKNMNLRELLILSLFLGFSLLTLTSCKSQSKELCYINVKPQIPKDAQVLQISQADSTELLQKVSLWLENSETL